MLLFIEIAFNYFLEKLWITRLISSFDLDNNPSRAPVDKVSSEITLYQVF